VEAAPILIVAGNLNGVKEVGIVAEKAL